MRISIPWAPVGGRLQLHVRAEGTPWVVRAPSEREEGLLDPSGPAFLAEGYPDWLRALCAAADADRELAEAIVAEVERRR